MGNHRFTVLCALMLIAGVVRAGTAVVETADGDQKTRVQFEYAGERLRLEPLTPSGDMGRMILREGQIYVLAEGMVFEFSGMAKMMGAQFAAPGAGPAEVSRFIGLEPTGRREEVAGASGEVHTLRFVDRAGREQREELLLSTDGRARELAAAMMRLNAAMMAAMERADTPGDAAMKAQLAGRGVLRYGREFRVVSFGGEPAAGRFELPAPPQKLPAIGALGGAPADGSGAPSTAPSAGGAGALGKLFGDKAQRQQGRIEQRSSDEVDQATDEAVDNVLNKAFDRLFNR